MCLHLVHIASVSVPMPPQASQECSSSRKLHRPYSSAAHSPEAIRIGKAVQHFAAAQTSRAPQPSNAGHTSANVHSPGSVQPSSVLSAPEVVDARQAPRRWEIARHRIIFDTRPDGSRCLLGAGDTHLTCLDVIRHLCLGLRTAALLWGKMAAGLGLCQLANLKAACQVVLVLYSRRAWTGFSQSPSRC